MNGRIHSVQARAGCGPGIAMKSGQAARSRKEHAMLIALPLAILGYALLKTLELAANHG
jgi:hypothetical protein